MKDVECSRCDEIFPIEDMVELRSSSRVFHFCRECSKEFLRFIGEGEWLPKDVA